MVERQLMSPSGLIACTKCYCSAGHLLQGRAIKVPENTQYPHLCFVRLYDMVMQWRLDTKAHSEHNLTPKWYLQPQSVGKGNDGLVAYKP
jgi:hypothetical protein